MKYGIWSTYFNVFLNSLQPNPGGVAPRIVRMEFSKYNDALAVVNGWKDIRPGQYQVKEIND